MFGKVCVPVRPCTLNVIYYYYHLFIFNLQSYIFLYIMRGAPKSGSWSMFLVGPTITREPPNELDSMRKQNLFNFCPKLGKFKELPQQGIFKQPPPVILQIPQPSNGLAWNAIYNITQRMGPLSHFNIQGNFYPGLTLIIAVGL